jgi:hypothetical protein
MSADSRSDRERGARKKAMREKQSKSSGKTTILMNAPTSLSLDAKETACKKKRMQKNLLPFSDLHVTQISASES